MDATSTATDLRSPAFLPAATHSYLERATDSLREAIISSSPPERYAHAHVSALRATAALLAARAQPVPPSRRARQKNAWVLLAEVAPELAEWASFFAPNGSSYVKSPLSRCRCRGCRHGRSSCVRARLCRLVFRAEQDESENSGQKQPPAQERQPAWRTRLVRGKVVRGGFVVVVVVTCVGVRAGVVMAMTAHGHGYLVLFRAKQVRGGAALERERT